MATKFADGRRQYEKASFQSAGSRNIPFAQTCVVQAPTIITDGNATLAYQYRASGAAAPVAATFPQAVAAGSVLIPAVTNMGTSTYVALAFELT